LTVAAVPLALANQNDHFNSLLIHPNLHTRGTNPAAFPFRTQVEIDQWTHGIPKLPGQTNIYIRYNPILDAAELTFNPGDISLFRGQLRPRFDLVDMNTGDSEISFQWEARWDSSWANLSLVNNGGRFGHHKFFQLSRNDPGDDRRYEMQMNYTVVDNTAVALPTIRLYGTIERDGVSGSNARTGTNTATYNYQPGGDTAAFYRDRSHVASDHVAGPTKPFLILPDRWIRFTVSVTFTGGKQRFRIWMADEDTDPVLVFANPDDPSLGFMAHYDTNVNGSPLALTTFGMKPIAANPVRVASKLKPNSVILLCLKMPRSRWGVDPYRHKAVEMSPPSLYPNPKA